MVFDGRTWKICFHERVRVNVCRADKDGWQGCEIRDYIIFVFPSAGSNLMLVAKVRVKGDSLFSKLLIFLIITGLVSGMTNIVKELLSQLKVGKFGRQIRTQALSSLVSLSMHSVPRPSVKVTEITQQGRSRSRPPPTLTTFAYSYKSPKIDHTCTREPEPKRTLPKEPDARTDFQMGRIDTM